MDHPLGNHDKVNTVTVIASDMRVAITHSGGDTVHCSTPVNGKKTPELTDKVWQMAKTDGNGKITYPVNSAGHPDSSYSFAPSEIEALSYYEPSL